LDIKGANILIAGGSGFIGSNLINALYHKREAKHIRATYHSNTPQVVVDGVNYVQCDLTKAEDCRFVVDDIDCVFMCAANSSGAAIIDSNPLSHVTPNAVMNALMLEAAYKAGVKKFCFLGSTIVYPLMDSPIKEDNIDTNLFYDKYFCVGWMKYFTEMMCKMYTTHADPPMTAFVVRIGNVYGEYDDFDFATSHATPALIRRVVERQDPVEVWGDGSDIKDLTYIGDTVQGLISAMSIIEGFEQIHLATGRTCTIKELLHTILKIDNYSNARVHYDLTKPSMIPRRVFDTTKAFDLLGYKATTPLEEGLRKTIEWYRSEL
jgi:GDP-L-fucose synthase